MSKHTASPASPEDQPEKPQSIQSKGGKTRDAILSAERKSEIAKAAAEARWSKGLPQATHEGELDIGGVKFWAAVVMIDGKPERLISQREFMKAMGMYFSGFIARQHREKADDGAAVQPMFLAQAALKPYISKHLDALQYLPVPYRTKRGASASGIPARAIAKICKVWMDAWRAGDLTGNRQQAIAKTAEIVYDGLAETGIIALVDEATGFQRDRAKDALAQILEQFIAKELRAWTSTFPVEFYEQIFRLKGWKFDPKNLRRPRVIGHYTNDFIYARLAPGVLEELKRKNPAVDGRRKNKNFQWLTGEIGDPKLRAHLDGIIKLMAGSETWEEFKGFANRFYKRQSKTELGFEVEDYSKDELEGMKPSKPEEDN